MPIQKPLVVPRSGRQLNPWRLPHGKKIDLLSDNAAIAADKLPATVEGWGSRSNAFYSLAESKARSGELEQEKKFLKKSIEADASATPQSLESVLIHLKSKAMEAALADNDLPTAEILAKETNSEGYPPGALTKLRKGKIITSLASRFFFPDYLADQSLARNLAGATLETARFGSSVELRSAGRNLGQSEGYEGLVVESLAAQGKSGDALKKISQLESDGFSGIDREIATARAAEIFLLTGDVASAETALSWAKKYTNKKSSDGGWQAARIEGLIMAEKGKIAQAIDFLDVYLSKRTASPNQSGLLEGLRSPIQEWVYKRFNGSGMVAEFLLWRGKTDAALEVAGGLDTLRQARFLDFIKLSNTERKAHHSSGVASSMNALKQARAGNVSLTVDQIQHIEDAIVIAMAMPGAVYDLDWCLKWIEKNAAGQDQPEALMLAAENLSRGIRRMRVAYERSGGTWGK